MDVPALQRYAIGLLGEYLSAEHADALKASYHLPELGIPKPIHLAASPTLPASPYKNVGFN